MAYTRDPNAIFGSSAAFPPPLNYASPQATGSQPVTYKGVTLLQPVGELPAGTRLELVRVDWLLCSICAYEDAEDALNGTAAMCQERFEVEAPPESAEQYVHETLALLRRGHSLLSPHCTCRHWLGEARARTLGITSARSEWCELPTVPREFTATELSQELAVSNVCAANTARDEPLVLLLQRHGVRVRIGATGLFFSLATHFIGPVRCKADLLWKLRSNHLPFEVLADDKAYAALAEDIRALEEEAVLFVLSKGPPAWLLHHNTPCPIMRPVDEDLRILWHSHELKKREPTLTDPSTVQCKKRR